MSQDRLYQLMGVMVWIDVFLLVTAPLVMRYTPPENRGSTLVCLWLIALAAVGMVLLLRARPPPRQ